MLMMVSRSTRGFLTWQSIDIDSIINSRCQRPTLFFFFFTPAAVFFFPLGGFYSSLWKSYTKKRVCVWRNHETSRRLPVASPRWGIVERRWLHASRGLMRSKGKVKAPEGKVTVTRRHFRENDVPRNVRENLKGNKKEKNDRVTKLFQTKKMESETKNNSSLV
jgi:hypothetical protein